MLDNSRDRHKDKRLIETKLETQKLQRWATVSFQEAANGHPFPESDYSVHTVDVGLEFVPPYEMGQ